MEKARLLKLAVLLSMGIRAVGIAGSVKDREWLKGKCGGDGAMAFQHNGIHLVELSDGEDNKVGNGKFPEFSPDASILAWQDGSSIKGLLRDGDTDVKTLISGVHNKSGVHWINDEEFVCYKDGNYLIVNAYSGETREDSDLNGLHGPPGDAPDEEGDVKLCDDGVWVVLKGEKIEMSNGQGAERPGHCSGSLSPDGKSVTGLHNGHDRCELKSFRSGGPSGNLQRTVGDCGSKGFDNQRWSSNNKDFVVAQWECEDKVGVWEVGSSDACLLAECGGETYGDFTVGSPRVTSWTNTSADFNRGSVFGILPDHGANVSVGPAGQLLISGLDPSRPCTVELLDLSGRVFATTLAAGSTAAITSLPRAAGGALLLKVRSGGQESVEKVIVRK